MRILIFSGLLLLIWACSSNSSSEATNLDQTTDSLAVADTLSQLVALDTNNESEAESFGVFFEKYGVEGSFILYDPQTNRYYTHNSVRTDEPFLPASTYLIL